MIKCCFHHSDFYHSNTMNPNQLALHYSPPALIWEMGGNQHWQLCSGCFPIFWLPWLNDDCWFYWYQCDSITAVGNSDIDFAVVSWICSQSFIHPLECCCCTSGCAASKDSSSAALITIYSFLSKFQLPQSYHCLECTLGILALTLLGASPMSISQSPPLCAIIRILQIKLYRLSTRHFLVHFCKEINNRKITV